MFRLLALVLLIVVVLLQLKLWQGEGSWTAEQELKVQVESQRAENARLKERNDALSAEVEDLKSGATAVEERARSELGMVKPGETFYRVVAPANANSSVRPEDVPEDAAHGCATSAITGCEGVAAVSIAAPASSMSASSPATHAVQAPKK